MSSLSRWLVGLSLVLLAGCDPVQEDSDADGLSDAEDGCPFNPEKQSVGFCGCDQPDADEDGDGAVSCVDECDEDPLKVSAGVCGCGVMEEVGDADDDGTRDCFDECDGDPEKTAEGLCGCGVVDDPTDSDGDGTLDCRDGCAIDPNKVAAGLCGCGISDVDTDSDQTPDCHDECPSDPARITAGPELPDDGIDNDCQDGDLLASDETGVFVATSGNDSNPGTMEAPLLTIGAGLEKAAADEKVLFVAAGTYEEEPLDVRVSMFGGYDAAWNRSLFPLTTRIDAVLAHGGTLIDVSGSNTNVIVQGFRLTSSGSDWSCTTVAVQYGATAYLFHNDIEGSSCDVSHGVTVAYGGAEAMLVGNRITGGTGSWVATALSVEYDVSVVAMNNALFGLGGGSHVSAVSIGEASATLINNTIDGGDGTWHAEAASAIRLSSVSSLRLINNNLFGAAQECLIETGTDDADSCIGSAAVVNTCEFAGCDEATGNIALGPQFVSATDIHLQSISPNRDSGADPRDYDLPVVGDADGDARPQGSQADIGWDEYAVTP